MPHAEDVFKLADRDPNEARRLYIKKQHRSECPSICYEKYFASTDYFDQQSNYISSLLEALIDKPLQRSNLKDLYKNENFIAVTAINITELLRSKAPGKGIGDVLGDLALETDELGIKFAIGKHAVEEKESSQEDIIMCHHTAATKDENGKPCPQENYAAAHKMIAYLCVKGLINKTDLEFSYIHMGIHAYPIEGWQMVYEGKGIKKFDFLKEEQTKVKNILTIDTTPELSVTKRLTPFL